MMTDIYALQDVMLFLFVGCVVCMISRIDQLNDVQGEFEDIYEQKYENIKRGFAGLWVSLLFVSLGTYNSFRPLF